MSFTEARRIGLHRRAIVATDHARETAAQAEVFKDPASQDSRLVGEDGQARGFRQIVERLFDAGVGPGGLGEAGRVDEEEPLEEATGVLLGLAGRLDAAFDQPARSAAYKTAHHVVGLAGLLAEGLDQGLIRGSGNVAERIDQGAVQVEDHKSRRGERGPFHFVGHFRSHAFPAR